MRANIVTDAWVTRPGAGIYRNLETGLERRYWHQPARGKWELVRPYRTHLLIQHGIVYWAIRSLKDGGDAG